jgi:hypothetical protein
LIRVFNGWFLIFTKRGFFPVFSFYQPWRRLTGAPLVFSITTAIALAFSFPCSPSTLRSAFGIQYSAFNLPLSLKRSAFSLPPPHSVFGIQYSAFNLPPGLKRSMFSLQLSVFAFYFAFSIRPPRSVFSIQYSAFNLPPGLSIRRSAFRLRVRHTVFSVQPPT